MLPTFSRKTELTREVAQNKRERERELVQNTLQRIPTPTYRIYTVTEKVRVHVLSCATSPLYQVKLVKPIIIRRGQH